MEYIRLTEFFAILGHFCPFFTINPEPSLGIQALFYKGRNNRQVSCLPRTKKPDNFLSTMFGSNEHGQSFPVFVGLRQRGC